MTTFDEIHIWGDSLGRGVTYSQEKGRHVISPERCDKRLAAACGARVLNHSMMGRTAPQALAEYRLAEPRPGAVCAVEFGGNDCDLDWPAVAAGQPVSARVELPAFSEALSDFILLARQRGERPVLVTPPPLHAGRYFRWVCRGLDARAVLRALGDAQHIYRWQERYANAVREAARLAACPLFDLRDAMLGCEGYPALISADGIHPSDAGYAELTKAALAFAEKQARRAA